MFYNSIYKVYRRHNVPDYIIMEDIDTFLKVVGAEVRGNVLSIYCEKLNKRDQIIEKLHTDSDCDSASTYVISTGVENNKMIHPVEVSILLEDIQYTPIKGWFAMHGSVIHSEVLNCNEDTTIRLYFYKKDWVGGGY